MKLKFLREKRKISQLKLAVDLNMNQNSISRYENGQRQADYETLIAFADYFDVSIDYLLERTNNDAPISDLTNKVVDEQLNELINNYARLNNLQRKDLVWYSGIIEQKDLNN